MFFTNEEFTAYNGNIEFRFTNDFSPCENEIILFIGPNGIGKSTLAKMLANYIDYDVIRNGKKFANKMLFHPQELIFLPGNVIDDYRVFLSESNFDFEDEIEKMDSEKTLSTFYEKYKNRTVNSLSGGEKQLILILRTLLAYRKMYECKHRIDGIIFDEPSKQLCNKNFKVLKEVFLNKFSEVKFPLFFITHEFNLVHAIFEMFLKVGKTISFIEIKEAESKKKDITFIGKFNTLNFETEWESIINESSYLSAFFEHRKHPVPATSSEIIGKVLISYPFHSGLYKVFATVNGNEREYLSIVPKNKNTELRKDEVILGF